MIGETVTVVRPGAGATDARGNATETVGTSTDVIGCAVAPRLAGEDTDGGRQGVPIGVTVYFPAGTDVRATDRLTIRGDTYVVDGEPANWTNPYDGMARGLEVAARRYEG